MPVQGGGLWGIGIRDAFGGALHGVTNEVPGEAGGAPAAVRSARSQDSASDRTRPH
jgi:hypothetical protein